MLGTELTKFGQYHHRDTLLAKAMRKIGSNKFFLAMNFASSDGTLAEIDSDGNLKTSIKIQDTPAVDAFGRLRVSNPSSIFDSTFEYNKQPLLWDEVIVNNGVGTHLPNESAVRMRCTTTDTDSVVRQTFQYFRYQPGKSHFIKMTAVFGAKKANVTKRIGYFDASNGFFFEQDGSNFKVVRRTKATGSIVDNPINQSSWNLDVMDGTGASGITLDESKNMIYLIDLQWLSAGRIRMCLDIDGVIRPIHQFLISNVLSTVSATTANLPLRYEITNTDTAASNTDLIQICNAVTSEGGHDPLGIPHSANNGIAEITITGRRAILSIRPKLLFNSITNRGTVIPEFMKILAGAENVLYEIVFGGTLGGTPSWTDVGGNSLIEFDVAGTTVTGGELIDSGYVAATGTGNNAIGSIEKALASKLVLSLDIAGTGQKVLSLVVTSMTASSSDCAGAFTWKELY